MSNNEEVDNNNQEAENNNGFQPVYLIPDDEEADSPSLKTKYLASFILAGVGDAIGYNNGSWEFNFSATSILREMRQYYGTINNITVTDMCLSDDTVMHIHTSEALNDLSWFDPSKGNEYNTNQLCVELAQQYVFSFDDMSGRAPGGTTGCGVSRLENKLGRNKLMIKNSKNICELWETPVHRSGSGGGCGASMRAASFGLAFSDPSLLIPLLVPITVEAGRMTHNHPTGYLGSFAAGFFTSLGIQGVPIKSWGKRLMDSMELVVQYLKFHDGDEESKWDVKNMNYFIKSWQDYLKLRDIENGENDPVFPENFGPQERDNYYNEIAWQGWGGASGHDSVIIAYDSLLNCNGEWDRLVELGCLHGGDSDSTGILACSWFGACYGFNGVPNNHINGLEYLERSIDNATKLYNRFSQFKLSNE